MKAEQLCDLASDWLARKYPGSLIVRELSIGDWGNARIDIAAITPEFIVGVEIKGEGDSVTRLGLQQALYSKAARQMFLLVDDSLWEKARKHSRGIWPQLRVQSDKVVLIDKWRAYPTPLSPRQLLQCLTGDELKKTCTALQCQVKGATRVAQWTKSILHAAPVHRIEEQVCLRLRERKWDWNGPVSPKRLRWA